MSNDKMALVVPTSQVGHGLCGFMQAQPVYQGGMTSLQPGCDYMPVVTAAGLELPEGAVDVPSTDTVEAARFMPRSIVETAPEWLQLIPYMFIHWAGKILSYRRPSKNAEARLSGLRSIGFGGHVDPGDYIPLLLKYQLDPARLTDPLYAGFGLSAASVIFEALKREVQEELGVTISPELSRLIKFQGWLHHGDTPVGAVHLGLVFDLSLGEDPLVRISDEITEPELLSLDDAYAKIDEYELWSQFVLRWLKGSNFTL